MNMKKFLLILSIISTLVYAKSEGVIHDTKILKVIDGDTVVIEATYLPEPLKKQLSLRIYGVDTPEKGSKAKCDYERNLSEQATAFTKEIINKSKKQQIILMSWDKYGGRVLGDLLLDGISLRNKLLENNYAKEYYGEKKESWCNK